MPTATVRFTGASHEENDRQPRDRSVDRRVAVVEDLRGKVPRYSDDMDGLMRKTLHSRSSRGLKERYLEKERRLRRPPAKVSLLASHRLGGLLDPVIAHLAAADPDLFGDLALDPAQLPWKDDGSPLDTVEEARMLDDLLPGAPPATVRILFTPRRLSDNWFSHWHAHRPDVDIKHQAADFCPSCHNALAAAGLPMGRLQHLAEVVRTLAVPARVVH